MYKVLILLHYHKLACTIANGLHLNNWRTGNGYAIITNLSSRVLIESTSFINSDVNLMDGGVSLVLPGSSFFSGYTQWTCGYLLIRHCCWLYQEQSLTSPSEYAIQKVFTKFAFHSTLMRAPSLFLGIENGLFKNELFLHISQIIPDARSSQFLIKPENYPNVVNNLP